MKILFLHLSDAHLKDNTKLSLININSIVNSLAQIGDFEECVLVFSGDVTQAGDKNAYSNAGKLVGYIAKNISQKYINGKIVQTLIAPGNHDNLVKNKERDNLELESYYEKKELDKRFNEDVEQLTNFYEFANRNRCFYKNKIIDVRRLKFGNFIIKANLINSAPFSLLGSGNRDKGMHYIPLSELEKLNIDLHQKYTISIIHHGPEWFNDVTKQKLYNTFNETTDLLFVGHEHFALNEDKTVNGKHIDVSSGLALYGTKTDHGFNALILDTEAHTLIGDLEKFDYNQNTNYKIQNLMMQENIANFKTFAIRSEQIYDEADLALIKQMVSLIVRKYFVYHDVELHGEGTRLSDKFFGKEQRKHFQIVQAKNQIIKK